MEITVNGKTFNLVHSIRTNMLYENVVGESIDYTQLTTINKIAQLFYCNILATLQANKEPLDFSWDDFITWMDENNGLVVLNDYALWIAKQLEIQFNITEKNKDKEEKKTKTKTNQKS